MSKVTKKVVSSKAELLDFVELTSFDACTVRLEGEFIRFPNGRITGQIFGTANNVNALTTINSGSEPGFDFGEDGTSQIPHDAPTDPVTGVPLWSWVKPNKKEGTLGYWLPIKSAGNRSQVAGHVPDLVGDMSTGINPNLARIAIGRNGFDRIYDGGHRTLSLWHLDAEYLESQCIDVVIFASSEDTIRGFDERQAKRTLRHVLESRGISPGFESELKDCVSTAILAVNGVKLTGSGKTLPHKVNPITGKAAHLTESDQVDLLLSTVAPFDKILGITNLLESIVGEILGEDKQGNEVTYSQAVHHYPTYKKWSPGTWFFSILEVLSAFNLPSDGEAKLKAFLQAIACSKSGHQLAASPFQKISPLLRQSSLVLCLILPFLVFVQAPALRITSR